MTLRAPLLFLIAAFIAGSGVAEGAKPPFDPGIYPPEVQQALHFANEECTAQGGGEVTFAPDTVRKLDLTGDGRDDYIIDFQDTKCAGSGAAYCGTGGCIIDILVTLLNGKIRSVFKDYVRYYEVLTGEAARTVRFQLHGSYCGGHGSPSCIREQRITATPFGFVKPN
jgi:hypothetical protein